VTLTKDRDYYRCMSTVRLIEETRYAIDPDWQELAIALAERLEEKSEELTGCHYDMRAERSDYEGAN
jgi:hypothetical protein